MEEMKEFILDLSLKREWYDMIERGEKTEEYREIKDYYLKRLVYRSEDMPPLEVKYMKKSDMLLFARTYNAVRFHRGQGGKQTMLFEYKGFKIGIGNPLWGAPEDKEVFIILLGKRIDSETPNILCKLNPGQSGNVYATDGVAPTICASEGMKCNTKIAEPIVLGWTRDEKGNVVDRHTVEVANAVTAAKRDNTQNYVVTPINDQDGCSRTIKRKYQKTSRANLERQDALGATGATDGFRIRKLTPRECFRLMGVADADIDKIQAAGISKSQQYKMAGNSIVVNCLAAIFRQLFIGDFNKVVQTEIF